VNVAVIVDFVDVHRVHEVHNVHEVHKARGSRDDSDYTLPCTSSHFKISRMLPVATAIDVSAAP
jgi:hypothetical protein